MDEAKIKNIVEGALLAAARPLKVDDLEALFKEDERPERSDIRAALEALETDYEGRAMTLRQVASGFRIQVQEEVSDWVSRLWEERPSRYSRALLETLALIAYRQPITRGEIEEVRGVSVSSSIVRTLQERGWIKVVGHRDVPGRPAMFGTTREFLDYFGLKSLDELPTLAEIRDIDSINVELNLDPENSESHSEPEESDDGGEPNTDSTESASEEPEADDEDSDVPREAAEGAEEAAVEGEIVDDEATGDSVDERNLGERADNSPFEESPYNGDDEGEDLDFEENYAEEEQEEDSARPAREEEGGTQASEGARSETAAGPEDTDTDGDDGRGSGA